MEENKYKGLNTMITDCICTKLYRNIQESHFSGVVHSVFSSTFNILTSKDELITVINRNKPMSANVIRISEDLSFLDCGIKQGMKINFRKTFIEIEEANININISSASEWDKEPIYSYNKDKIENVFSKLGIMRAFIMDSVKTEGILPLLTTLNEKYDYLELLNKKGISLDKSAIFMKERFWDFVEAYICENKESIDEKVKKIVGYGAGLTPSMDDFLSGLMISRIYIYDYLNLDMDNALDFNKAMIRKIDNITTRISEEMLKLASLGEANDDIRNLMISLISHIENEIFIIDLKKVASLGETSGIDIISGIYIGSCILLKSTLEEVVNCG